MILASSFSNFELSPFPFSPFVNHWVYSYLLFNKQVVKRTYLLLNSFGSGSPRSKLLSGL
jgi:hypothetical protein